MRIADDGQGFDPEASHRIGMGLSSMHERAKIAGGWWKIASAPGGGTTVEFWLPADP